ncbi:hypothetical protein ABW06_13055 [Pluralibacter gergoviae]|uniref:Uncharacterized protein n=1 Tax=Pluralibacter gergoviae TaxID=61647 RepID=A0A0J5QXB0_PLUGE|nr:hypothetical protein ABW06_13055 [Pluralibacter gergoviae]KMK23427.1 hypothetical protein ABW10_13645 [Pluralibacter gergoviae]KMK37372.1 hypothetical protein ABW13_18460 [Pluralibacter gergoviae]
MTLILIIHPYLDRENYFVKLSDKYLVLAILNRTCAANRMLGGYLTGKLLQDIFRVVILSQKRTT